MALSAFAKACPSNCATASLISSIESALSMPSTPRDLSLSFSSYSSCVGLMVFKFFNFLLTSSNSASVSSSEIETSPNFFFVSSISVL
jgi:hypothetical protein